MNSRGLFNSFGVVREWRYFHLHLRCRFRRGWLL